LYGCDTWSVTLREEYRFEDVLKTGCWGEYLYLRGRKWQEAGEDCIREIKSDLNSGNANFHTLQNLLSSRLLLINVKIKMYITIILPTVLYGCDTWSVTLREEYTG
jgi:hypothetical protein